MIDLCHQAKTNDKHSNKIDFLLAQSQRQKQTRAHTLTRTMLGLSDETGCFAWMEWKKHKKRHKTNTHNKIHKVTKIYKTETDTKQKHTNNSNDFNLSKPTHQSQPKSRSQPNTQSAATDTRQPFATQTTGKL